jgi:hypothetical protein
LVMDWCQRGSWFRVVADTLTDPRLQSTFNSSGFMFSAQRLTLLVVQTEKKKDTAREHSDAS